MGASAEDCSTGVPPLSKGAVQLGRETRDAARHLLHTAEVAGSSLGRDRDRRAARGLQ